MGSLVSSDASSTHRGSSCSRWLRMETGRPLCETGRCLEGGRTMGEEHGDLEENLHLAKARRLWGLRPWKRHSMIVTVGGFLYVLIGFLYVRSPPSPGRQLAFKVVLQVAPIQVWGGVFMLAGFLSMISARWPPFSEKWGYMVLTGMSSGW